VRYPRRIRLSPDVYKDPANVFHVVVRAHHDIPAFSQEMREAIWKTLLSSADTLSVTLHAAVLMPDHVHLILQPAAGDIVKWLGGWKSLTARAMWPLGLRGSPWQPRFYDRALRDQTEYAAAWSMC
jgi:REP element-mobilizing transposase RayT